MKLKAINSMRIKRILITGASGQIGSVLTEALVIKYGKQNVIVTDINKPSHDLAKFEILNILDKERLLSLIDQYQITEIYHLAALLSAKGEQNPLFTWELNMNGLFNVLEAAREKNIDRIFYPSSIAIYGDRTPRIDTPQDTVFNPSTVYGMSKLAGEHWCAYYHKRFGLDIRSLRYPGIVSYQSLPGGGTTDYAVEIFHYAIKGDHYTCYLKDDTRLPMMYMPDAIRATLSLMEAPSEKINERGSYNLSGMDFTPKELVAEIQKNIPDFTTDYAPDFRQAIADSWSDSIDDSAARNDWGWSPNYDLESMTKDMILNLKKKIKTALPSTKQIVKEL